MNRRARTVRSPPHARRVPFWVALSLRAPLRAALVSLAVSGSLGCLADPPTFAPRGQIPPFIIAGQVLPPLGSIYVGPAEMEVNVPFRSEDVNRGLFATFYLDLVPGAPEGSVLAEVPVASSNYEELRMVRSDFIIPRSGCHSLTLIMTYEDNLDPVRNRLPIDDERAARVVWWLNINDEEGDTLIADCPRESQADAVPGGG